MDSQITVRVSEELRAAVEASAQRLNRKPSEVVRLAIEAFVMNPPTGKPADRVKHLIGSLDSGTPDLAERRQEYVLVSLKRGSRAIARHRRAGVLARRSAPEALVEQGRSLPAGTTFVSELSFPEDMMD